jgi:acyl-CoA dehydrogenase
MRSIGSAEKALELLCERATQREAFGRPLYKLGGNIDVIADARMNIEQARLLTLKTAWMMDHTSPKEARIWISMIKTVVPNMALKVIDDAIQIHGGIGVSQDTPLAEMWSGQRTLRLADGPDAVHRMVVGRNEIKQYLAESGDVAATFRDG